MSDYPRLGVRFSRNAQAAAPARSFNRPADTFAGLPPAQLARDAGPGPVPIPRHRPACGNAGGKACDDHRVDLGDPVRGQVVVECDNIMPNRAPPARLVAAAKRSLAPWELCIWPAQAETTQGSSDGLRRAPEPRARCQGPGLRRGTGSQTAGLVASVAAPPASPYGLRRGPPSRRRRNQRPTRPRDNRFSKVSQSRKNRFSTS